LEFRPALAAWPPPPPFWPPRRPPPPLRLPHRPLSPFPALAAALGAWTPMAALTPGNPPMAAPPSPQDEGENGVVPEGRALTRNSIDCSTGPKDDESMTRSKTWWPEPKKTASAIDSGYRRSIPFAGSELATRRRWSCAWTVKGTASTVSRRCPV
jgi:hypothetical protein